MIMMKSIQAKAARIMRGFLFLPLFFILGVYNVNSCAIINITERNIK
jgi:hypothetical protein